MSKNITNNALPTFGEIDKAKSDLLKSATVIVAEDYDGFSLTKRVKKTPTSKMELALFHNQEKKALREKYLSALDVDKGQLSSLEAMLNGMYNLAKRHSFDTQEGL